MFFYGESESSNRFVHLQVVDYRANGKAAPPATRRYKKRSSECGSPFSPREIVKEEKSDKASESPRSTKDEEVLEKWCRDDDEERNRHNHHQQAVNEDMGNKSSSLASKIRKGPSKTKNVKGKKKKEKENVCENDDVETAATTTAATTTASTTSNKTYTTTATTTENSHLDEYVDVRIPKVAALYNVEGNSSTDGDDNDSGCGESGDKSTVEDRYEDHACQTDDASDSNSSISTSTEDVRSVGVAVNACPPQCHEATIEKSFEDFGVQTDEETYDRPLFSSSIDEDTLVQALRRKSETSSSTDLNLIDAILEKNEQTIETMKTNYIKEYLNSTITTIAEDDAEDDEALQLIPDTQRGTEKEGTGEEEIEKDGAGDEDEEVQPEAEVSLESVMSDAESEGTSSYDEEQNATNSESDNEEVDRLRVANGQWPVKNAGGGGKVAAAKQNSVESNQSDREFKPKMLLAQEEEEVDSGTELRYDEVANKEVPTPTTTTPATTADYDYNKYVDKIKPLLYDAELVANLYIRLANKYSTIGNAITALNEKDEKVQHIHSAQIAYDVIKESSLTNFAHVVSHLLSYLGAIKAEKPIPESASVPNLLTFLEEMVKRNTMTAEHVTMMTCFLARPNRALLPHHDLRMSFLLTCFKQQISQLNVHTDDRRYLRSCFIKLCEYFVHLDMTLTQQLTRDYLLPHVNDKNSTTFIMDTLTYMGLVKSEEMVVTTQDITAPLLLLDFIFVSKRMSLLTSQKLYAFIQLNNPRFKFCSSEREAVANTLRKAIDF